MIKKKRGAIDPAVLQERLKDSPDIVFRKVYIEGQYEAFFIYIRNRIDNDLIQRDFIRPILDMKLSDLSDERLVQNLPGSRLTLQYDNDEIISGIMEGNSVFVFDKLPYAVASSISEIEKRGIDEPITEKNVRGPHEGFIEVLDINLGILRRKIKSDALKFKSVTLGDITKQKVVIAYIDGVANMAIVEALQKKIGEIKTDGLLSIGQIEQSIASRPNSIFPQFLATERPDKVTAALLEGRLAILMEGTPVALVAPVTFISFFHAPDDYSTQWIHGTFLRFIRIFGGLFIAVILPSLYIAVTSFHYYAVPLTLLITLAETRAKVPFPPIIEVLILEVMIEMVREAAIRLPTYIGTAIGVVAGLIIGQAAVEAGLVSGLLIVIVAATAVASYVIPSTDMALSIRFLRFFFIIAASIFGIIGMVVCTAFTVAHLIILDSLGQPYFEPVAPFSSRDMKDAFVRMPVKKLKTRPEITKAKDRTRGDESEGQ